MEENRNDLFATLTGPLPNLANEIFPCIFLSLKTLLIADQTLGKSPFLPPSCKALSSPAPLCPHLPADMEGELRQEQNPRSRDQTLRVPPSIPPFPSLSRRASGAHKVDTLLK